MAAEDDSWTPPGEFDEYQLVRQLGRGSMGLVYLARDRLLDRAVAVKFITALEPGAREQFTVEARAAARIQHPNVVGVYRVGELHHRPFLITEYVGGQSLAELKLPVPWQRALELGVGLARGLVAAHRQGVLHRDIKLANAMLADSGDVKLLDFSLAKLVDAPSLDRLRGDPGHPRDELATARTAPGVHPVGETEPERLADTMIAGPRPAGAGRREGLDATEAGALVGTPHYMAPELWRGEPASPASDLYALGALLYCLCSGHPPTDAGTLLELAERVQVKEPPPLRERAPDTDPGLAAIVDRCLRRDPQARFASAEALCEALEGLQQGHRATASPRANPYRGLEVFDAAHRALFFGRAAEVSALVSRLRAHSFVLVAGDSGVGKSSLCRAGVLPALCDGALDPSIPWRQVTLTPGRRPVHALLSALKGHDIDETRREGTTDPLLLARAIGAAHTNSGCVLFVDQLEELITLAPPGEAALASQILAQLAVGIPRVRLLATVRGDFLTRIAPLPGFGELMVKGLFFLDPLSPANVRKAIVGPAHARGVRFESEALVAKLVTSGVEGSLPLLQFALAELWEARPADSDVITANALEKIGGVSGALARHAEGVLARLTPQQRRAARSLLLRLVTIDETRASLGRDELMLAGDDGRVALESLLAARLILVRDVPEGPPVYEIAHEALIRGWVSLQVWLDEEKENRQIRHRLADAAAEWDRLGRPRDALWSARQVDEGRRLEPASLRPREVAFLAASADRAARARRLRVALWISAPLFVALGLGVAYLAQRGAVRREVDLHLGAAAELLAEARARDEEVERRRAAAFAAFDAGDATAGEAAWQQALADSPEVQKLYARAAGELELALGFDPTRADVHATLGDALFEQALLAERDHQPAQAEALLLRVALHDPGGERSARRQAPAEVDVTSDPAGAEVTAARYERDAAGKLRLVDVRRLGATPLAPFTLPAGSYLWTFAAPGRTEVRYPVVLRPGERFAAELDLPRVEDTPPGFVYVPAGRFLAGSKDDENLRQGFLTAAPMHELRTGAYFIARDETTYAQWIEFLDALPPDERARRSRGPALSRGTDGRWRLETRRGDQLVVAAAGEPLRFQRQGQAVVQDWSLLPIGGITWEDSRVYIEWLARTGRVPGARFCDEFEWERAARGADGRRFPHGDKIAASDANHDATYARDPQAMSPEPVGSFPASDSPFGLHDMMGNVWEWVRPIGASSFKLARGGSYLHGWTSGNSANRALLDENYLERTVGLRVCATPRPAHSN